MPKLGITLAVLVVCGLSLVAQAQRPTIEYGDPDELRGVTRVFVDTDTDLGLRRAVREELRKKLPNLRVVSRPEDADLHLRFYYLEDQTFSGDQSNVPNTALALRALSVEKIVSQDRIRLLMNIDRVRSESAARRLPIPIPMPIPPLPIPIPTGIPSFNSGEYPREISFIREFIKEYQAVN